MAKAKIEGDPKVVLTLTKHEAEFVQYVLMECIQWASSDGAAESIYTALGDVDVVRGDFTHEDASEDFPHPHRFSVVAA